MSDPIEIAGLKQAFAASTDKKQFCAIGTHIPHVLSPRIVLSHM